MNKKCLGCGVIFNADRKKRKFHSRECFREWIRDISSLEISGKELEELLQNER